LGTRVDAGLTPNGRASVLIHELAHALVRADRQTAIPSTDTSRRSCCARAAAWSLTPACSDMDGVKPSS
jgi:hypothetical protein